MRRDTDETPFTEEDIARMGPARPEIVLISDYLANYLSPEAKAEVERRLADDPEFVEKVWPTMKLWQMTHSVRVARARELRNARQDRKRPPRGLWTTVTDQLKKLPKAAVLLVAGLGSLSLGTLLVVRLTTPPAAKVQAFSTADGAPLAVRYDTKYTPRTGDSTEKIPRTVIRTVQHAAAPAAPEVLDRAPVIGIKNGTVVETGPAETIVIPLLKRGRVVLKPNSRFTWTYTMAILPWDRKLVTGSLDGEATIEPDSGSNVLVWTSAGKVDVMRGISAVRCEPGCEAMLVSVGRGFAAVIGAERGNILPVRAGEWARLPKGGKPAKDPTGEGFPLVEPGKP